MSKRSKRLQVVLELAEKKKKQADQFLAASRQRVLQDQQTLQQLQQYMAEYQNSYLGVHAEGCSGNELHAQQAFMQKIQDAADAHKQVMAQNRQELEVVGQHWKQAYARCQGVSKLTEKVRQQEMLAEEKALQKQLDERSQMLTGPELW